MHIPRAIRTAFVGAAIGTIALSTAVAAADTVVVTPTNQQGWREFIQLGGNIEFVSDVTAPGGSGALELTTTLLPTSAKATYLHDANTPLASVSELSYWTKQVSGPLIADPAYQLVMCLNGGTTSATCGFTTLVFEPYQNPALGPIVAGVWQKWDVDQGLFWSTRTVTCSNGTILGTPGGPASYTLGAIQTACPGAVVIGFNVNIGSNNPGYVVRTDLFNFNETTYDFELTNEPKDKDDCKDGGWMELTDDNNQPFKNQGQCIKYANGAGGG